MIQATSEDLGRQVTARCAPESCLQPLSAGTLLKEASAWDCQAFSVLRFVLSEGVGGGNLYLLVLLR